jgi:uncharacterized DUF497 family protein
VGLSREAPAGDLWIAAQSFTFCRLTLAGGTAKPYTMDEGEFEWDDAKAAANYDKHGVNFETALRVFEDPFRGEWHDTSERYDEDRYATIGMVGDHCVLCRAHHERREDADHFGARGQAIRAKAVS